MATGFGLAGMLLAQRGVLSYKKMPKESKESKDRQLSSSTETTAAPMSRNVTEDGSPAVQEDLFSEENFTSTMSEVMEFQRTPYEDALTTLPPWDSGRYKMLHVLRAASPSWLSQIEIHFDSWDKRAVPVKRFTPQWFQAQSETVSTLKDILMLERAGGVAPGCAADTWRSGAYKDDPSGAVLLVCDEDLGDNLFDCCETLPNPGSAREAEALTILRSLIKATLDLDSLGLVHGRIRAENTWLQHLPNGDCKVLLSDFGESRTLDDKGRDAMFLAPELVDGPPKPTHAGDLFSCGVLGYALAMGRYPWFSTRPGECKAFSYARSHGVRSLLKDRRCPASKEGRMSPEYKEILGCLLEVDPGIRQQKAMSMQTILPLSRPSLPSRAHLFD
ncbi:GIN4 [Symbiodinium natans]|uniref:GIN4 protein n=1 Tax=Symbiodinium natans TaxID=878477 RepID=A0A812V429_9DINO|nr:GIN4 [Symbiodinium natans]